MGEIRLAIAGVGNCASSLLQGIDYYRNRAGEETTGLLYQEVGGYKIGDIRPVAAFDVDLRKIGKPLHKAIFAPPNCTTVFQRELTDYGVPVQMSPVLDGVAAHMKNHPEAHAFRVADAEPCDVAQVLRDTKVDVLVSYLPVGSENATRHYAQACLDAGVALVNCIPVFIASHPEWSVKFRERGLPIVGDDIKSQFGATIVHRTLAGLMGDRGVPLRRTNQLNTGGNTDFHKMLEQTRLKSKRISKTESVQSQLPVPLAPDDIHIGPSDYVAWQRDNKVCFLRMEWEGFGGVAMNLELRLSVEDSPNSAGVVIDAIRCCKLALERGESGVLYAPASYFCKHPPRQYTDDVAFRMTEEFIADINRDERNEVSDSRSRNREPSLAKG